MFQIEKGENMKSKLFQLSKQMRLLNPENSSTKIIQQKNKNKIKESLEKLQLLLLS